LLIGHRIDPIVLCAGGSNTGNTSQAVNPSVAPERIQGRIGLVDATKYDRGFLAATNGSELRDPMGAALHRAIYDAAVLSLFCGSIFVSVLRRKDFISLSFP
jgi:hypothetical protein